MSQKVTDGVTGNHVNPGAKGNPWSAITMDNTHTIGPFVISLKEMDNASIELNWAGTPTGNFKVEVCNSYVPNTIKSGTIGPYGANNSNPLRSGNWVDVTSQLIPSAQQPAGGSGGTIIINLNQMSALWVRISYVPNGASAGGALDMYWFAKSLG